MGLKNTGGYIYYDGNDLNWLDPSKPAARQYLCGLAREIADLGFDEILLTDVGYPTTGPLDKIDYNGADRAESIRTFLEELRSALGEYGVAVSIELPPEVDVYKRQGHYQSGPHHLFHQAGDGQRL